MSRKIKRLRYDTAGMMAAIVEARKVDAENY